MGTLKAIFRKTVGDRAYEDLSRRKNNARALWQYFVARYVRGELGYDRAYYEDSDRQYGHSFAVMAATLVERYRPDRVADVGCGSGAFGAQLLRHGVREVYGFDQSGDAVALAKENGLTAAEVLDVTAAERVPVTADVCTSFEVAEHVPGIYARKFCELLAGTAPVVLMTAAPPGQGGHLHVNEQSAEYWIDLMRRCGLEHDSESAAALKTAWQDKAAAHYYENLLAFRRA